MTKEKKIKLLKNIINNLIPGSKKHSLPKGTSIIEKNEIEIIFNKIKKINNINDNVIINKFGEKLIHLYYGNAKVEKIIEKNVLKKNFMKKYFQSFNYKILKKNKRKKIYHS